MRNRRRSNTPTRFSQNKNESIDAIRELSKYLKPYISHDMRVTNLSNENVLVEISKQINKLEIFQWTKGEEHMRFKSIMKYGYPTTRHRLDEIIGYLKHNNFITK